MTKQQMTLLVALLLISVLSVGAFLMTGKGQQFAGKGPDPSLLPATPAAPTAPPVVDSQGFEEGEEDFNNLGASVGNSPFGVSPEAEFEDLREEIEDDLYLD